MSNKAQLIIPVEAWPENDGIDSFLRQSGDPVHGITVHGYRIPKQVFLQLLLGFKDDRE